MRKIEGCLDVGPSDQATLERMIADGKTPQKIVKRATIALMSGRGRGTKRRSGVEADGVAVAGGLHGGRPRPAHQGQRQGAARRQAVISDAKRLEIVRRTAKDKPANATHWSARMLAAELGVGHTTIQRVWKQHGLKPHLNPPGRVLAHPGARSACCSNR